ncbi:DUF5995 family protein [Niabella terrae]
MSYTNISEIIQALQSITDHCKKQQLKAGYFSALYLRMTQAVKSAIDKGLFMDGARMERLDILFAERYINAFNCYYRKQACSQSWQFAFEAASNKDNIVLQHLLLGINTHINLDLAIATALTAAGGDINELEADFNLINDTIRSLTDDVQECLSRIWLPMRLLSKISNNRQDAVLNFSINKARQSSWANALLLSGMEEAGRQNHIQAMDGLVLRVGQAIQEPGIPVSWLLRFIRKTEYDNVAENIRLIENLVVE